MTKKNEKIDSIKKFLIAIKNNRYVADQTDDYGIPYSYANLSDEIRVIEIAIEEGYIKGVELYLEKEYFYALRLNDPIVTPKGEQYLKDQSFFNQHPIVEKILIALVSSIISAITTLIVSHFIN